MRNFNVTAHGLRRFLTVASVVYLAIPIVIFLVGWLRPLYGLGLSALAVVALARYLSRAWRGADIASPDEQRTLPVLQLAIGLIPIVALALISGAGGWGAQDVDWLKHNAILKDLVERPWPVVYQTSRDRVMLVYYTAYYLLPALAGKAGGWVFANHVLFVTTLAGFVLAVLWLPLLTRANAVLSGIVFAVFSGMDAVGWAIHNVRTGLPVLDISPVRHIEFWATLWEYSSNTTLMFWVPQHAIAAWLVSALLVDATQRGDTRIPWLLLLALTSLWSPFVTLGLAPIVLALLVVDPSTVAERVRSVLSFGNAVGVVLLIVTGLYFFARSSPFAVGGPPDAVQDAVNGFLPWIGHPLSVRTFVIRYALFCVIEFLLLSAAAWGGLRAPDEAWPRRLLVLLGLAIGMLLLLPLFRYGYYNDLVMRTSIPSLFVVCIAAITALGRWRQRPAWATALVLLLVVGLPTSFLEIQRHTAMIAAAPRLVVIPRADSVENIFQLQVTINPPFPLTRQYLGASTSFFATHLVRAERSRSAAAGAH